MFKSTFGAAALVAGFVMIGSTANAASVTGLGAAVEKSDGVTQVRRGGHIGVHRGFYGGSRRGFRPHFGFYAAPLVLGYSYYNSGYFDGGRCAWLYRKARYTGSHYWWHRYRTECSFRTSLSPPAMAGLCGLPFQATKQNRASLGAVCNFKVAAKCTRRFVT